MSTHISLLAFVAVAMLAVSGCEGNHYEIELKPQDSGMERSLTAWRSGSKEQENVSSFPSDELRQITTAYGDKNAAKKDGKHTFKKLFAEAMPNDVGGSGSFRRWETSLGSVSIYLERFRGQDDLLSELEGRLRAIDLVVDILRDWLSTELEGEKGFEQLKDFLEGRFRRDFKNLCLYAWVPEFNTGQDDKEIVVAECLLRAGHYLVERSYLSIEEFPEITRAIQEHDATGHMQRLLSIMQRLVARQMGVQQGQELPKCLNFLGHELAIKKSLDDYLGSTEQYAALVKQWEEAEATESPHGEKPVPTEVIGDALIRAFLPSFIIGPGDSLRVKLDVQSEPFMTNGKWDADNHQVHWSHRMLSADADTFEYPGFLFAIWTEPDTETQKQRFGKQILAREELASYCVWHRSLTKPEAAEWESFLSQHGGQEDFLDRLSEFRFAHEPAPEPGKKDADDLAQPARELIEAALGKD